MSKTTTTTTGKVRQRAWKPKNRTGCKTCKIRKVKCDEEKPHCKRCTSTGRTCDGYDDTFRGPKSNSNSPWSTPSPPKDDHSRAYLQPNRQLTRSVSPSLLAPALQLKSIQERESFEFFTTYAVSSLKGFIDSPFWQREILQAAHQHESIQHCIIALGAMYRRFYDGTRSHIDKAHFADHQLQFALRQSNQAIQALLKDGEPGSRLAGVDKVTLMTCTILFSSMACLQGHQRDALQHLRSGLRMLNEMDRDAKTKHNSHAIDIESLRSIIIGLDMQARSIMKSSEVITWEPLPQTKEPELSPDPDLTLSSLLAIQRYLETLFNHILAFLQHTLYRPPTSQPHVSKQYSDLLARFNRMTSLLAHLTSKATTIPPNDITQSLTALCLLHAQIEYVLRSPRGDLATKFRFTQDTPFDQPTHFVRMLHLAEQLLPGTQAQSHLTPVFTTSSIGPLAALWLVACRAPSSCDFLRKRAVQLMLSYPRREGLWDSMVAGHLAQEVLRLEQESVQAELGLMSGGTARELIVPEDLRIVTVALTYDEEDDRRARVQFRNLREMIRGEEGRFQVIEW